MSSKPEQNHPKCDNNISEKFKEIILSNGIKDVVSEVIVKDAGLKGEGFASLTQHVTVKFENPQIKPLNLFVKVHTPNASHTEMLDELKAFEKEAMFLINYVTAAKDMCKLKGREGFLDFYPKCYYGDTKMTVLENLVLDKGYEMINKEIRQELEAARFAIKTLAKHHAISHVMIQENGGAKKFFERFPMLDYEWFDKPFAAAMFEPSIKSAIDTNIKMLETSGVQNADYTVAKLKSFDGKAFGIMVDTLTKNIDESMLVLDHGDYWNNNMMFLKDKGTNQITHHMAIDLQLTRYSSLAIDLGYYLFTSVQQKVRQNHLQELLELYKETLNSVSEEFGHPMNLTYEKLYMEYRRKFLFGFWIGITIATGPGMAIFKDMDVSEIDLKDWVEVSDRLICKWIDNNPEKTAEFAEQLVVVIKEYEALVLED